MITKAQLQEKLVELAKKAQETGDLRESMSAYLAFIKDNYNDLDSEAKIIGDKAFEILGTLAKETLEKMPDSIEKRKMTRMHASAYGDHWDIESIAETLEKPTHLDKPILKATEEFFLEHTQMIADLMHDVLSNNLKGPDAAILALYCSAIDNMHMVRRYFLTFELSTKLKTKSSYLVLNLNICNFGQAMTRTMQRMFVANTAPPVSGKNSARKDMTRYTPFFQKWGHTQQ